MSTEALREELTEAQTSGVSYSELMAERLAQSHAEHFVSGIEVASFKVAINIVESISGKSVDPQMYYENTEEKEIKALACDDPAAISAFILGTMVGYEKPIRRSSRSLPPVPAEVLAL